MNDNTVLPIRFFSKEQYKELKDNGEFTGVNTLTREEETIPDIPQALNCVADTTEQDVAKVQQGIDEIRQDIDDLKENIGTGGGLVKFFMHTISGSFYNTNELDRNTYGLTHNIGFSFLSSSELEYSAMELVGGLNTKYYSGIVNVIISIAGEEILYTGSVTVILTNGLFRWEGIISTNYEVNEIHRFFYVQGSCGHNDMSINDSVEEV